MPDWLVERGIGETRAVLVGDGTIIEARIERDGVIRAGSVFEARLARAATNGRNAVARDGEGTEFLLPRGAPGTTEGAIVRIEVTREAIPGAEPWKRALARMTDRPSRDAAAIEGQDLGLPATRDRLSEAGWNELIEEARTGLVGFAGGELRISATPAMTLIDVDGHLAPEELGIAGAAAAAQAIRRLGIGGSIGIDLPTSGSRSARQSAAAAIDGHLPQPFERTAVNGFGFVQVVRPRLRASLVELRQDRASFEARALLRRAALEPPGAKCLVAHSSVIELLQRRNDWIEALARQVGGPVGLRADPRLPMSGGYAEAS